MDSKLPHHKEILLSSDMYSLSNVRDLLFHAQEHTFTILSIKDQLLKLKLNFCGFEADDILKKYLQTNKENDLYDLDKWDCFEKYNPMLFGRMYQFWCQKI